MGAIIPTRRSTSLRLAAEFVPKDDECESEEGDDGGSEDSDAEVDRLVNVSDEDLDQLAAIEMLSVAHTVKARQLQAMKNTHPVVKDIYFDTRAMTVQDMMYHPPLPGMQDPAPIWTLTKTAYAIKQAEIDVTPPLPLGNGFPGVPKTQSLPVDFNDPFDEILRLGLANKIEDRDEWVQSIKRRSAEVEEQERIENELRRAREAVNVNAKTLERGVEGGLACAQRTLHEWPAGGMHEHGW